MGDGLVGVTAQGGWVIATAVQERSRPTRDGLGTVNDDQDVSSWSRWEME